MYVSCKECLGSAAVTFTAQWTAVAHHVTYSVNGGSGSAPTQVDQVIGSTFVVPAAVSRDGFSFVGWSDGVSVYQPGATYVMGSAAVTFTAQWTAVAHHGKDRVDVSGFAFEKSIVTGMMSSKIRTWLAGHSNVYKVTCTGYTGYNDNKLSSTKLDKLGKARALAACNVLKRLNPNLVIRLGQTVRSNSKAATIRKVVIVGSY